MRRCRRFPRRVVILWAASALVVLSLSAPAAEAQSPAAPAEPPQEAASDPAAETYKQHMSNGVKLFQDKNYAAAIVEFQAAYDARPKANPLINIALCHKGLFNYPKAVAALSMALEKHGDSMDPADKKAAEDAITEMRALLAYVTVRVSPEHAVVSVDGEELPPGAAKKPVPLGPGPHRIAARADGHASAEAQVSVASGDKSKVVALELQADKGYVRIKAPDADTSIAIDKKPVGRGAWEGYVAPGTHVVQIYKAGGPSAAAEVLIASGRAQAISQGKGGALDVKSINGAPFFGAAAAAAHIDTPPDPVLGGDKAGGKADKKKDPPLNGFYGLVTGSVFGTVFGGPSGKEGDAALGGWSVGARGGYRLNTAFGLELMLDYSRADGEDEEQTGYELRSTRIGGNVRFMSPGYRARFIAVLGLGLAYDVGALDKKEEPSSNVYFNLEQGVEFNLNHILLSLVVQQITGTTGKVPNLAEFADPQFTIGLGLRAGYGTW